MSPRFRDRSKPAAAVITWAALLLCGGLVPTAAQDVTVIRGATVIDGTGADPMPNAVVVVRGDRIDAIGPGLPVPPGATVVDATGKFVTPGLWDKHLHYKSWFPELMITNGVTSGYAQAGGPWITAQKEGVEKGKLLGPRMFLRIRSIDFWGPPEDARKMARQIIEEGADFIKIYTGTPAEVIVPVAEEARKAGLHVEGHLGIGARAAGLAGVNGLTHATGIELDTVKPDVLERLPQLPVIDTGRARVIWPTVASWNESRTGGPNPDAMEYWLWIEDPRRLMLFGMMDQTMARDLITFMVERKMFIEGCLTYIFRHVHDRVEEYRNEDARILSDPDLHYLPPIVPRNVLDYTQLDKVSPEDLALMKRGYRNYQWFVKEFVNAGGRIVVGPDTTSVNHATMLPGVTTAREMELMVDAGLTPMQVILAATRWPAETLGKKASHLGTLEKGKMADLLVLSRNPLEDIRAFKQIERVMQGGRWQPMGYHYDFTNPIPNPANEDAVDFAELPPASETPAVVTSLSPALVTEGSAPFTLTLRGRNFLSSSVVQVGTRWLQTELVSPTELRATVPAELVASVGTLPVRVVHRPPGWGRTNTVHLVVNYK